jgi:hypothetical protein
MNQMQLLNGLYDRKEYDFMYEENSNNFVKNWDAFKVDLVMRCIDKKKINN